MDRAHSRPSSLSQGSGKHHAESKQSLREVPPVFLLLPAAESHALRVHRRVYAPVHGYEQRLGIVGRFSLATEW